VSAPLAAGEILGISVERDHPRVCPEQEATVLRIDRQDFPLDSIRGRSVIVHRPGGNPVIAVSVIIHLNPGGSTADAGDATAPRSANATRAFLVI
jgi:hypothetical protein